MARLRRGAALGPLVAGVLLLGGPAAAAFLASTQVGSNSFHTATLQPPTGLSASAGCSGPLNPKVSLAWTATVSSFADGYDVYRGTTSGGPYTNIDHVTGRTTTAYTDTDVGAATTYYYVLRSTASNWTSANSNQAQATTPLICL